MSVAAIDTIFSISTEFLYFLVNDAIHFFRFKTFQANAACFNAPS